LVGDGELMEELKNQVQRLGVGDAVCFWGRRNNVAQILEKVDLVVLPSLWEGDQS
jgi:glycosyltransferase involved in cell wall biosynthesis